MGQCKDCKYWKIGEFVNRNAGECLRLWFNATNVIGAHDVNQTLSSTDVFTCGHFGCIHFEEKERGPFTYVDAGCIGYAIRYKRSKVIGYMRPELEAEQVVNFLNEHWDKEHSCIRKE